MDFVKHPSNNINLGAPPGWDHERVPCNALPATRVVVEGQPAFASYWKPSVDELSRLLAGEHVCLMVYGQGHPPVSIGVQP